MKKKAVIYGPFLFPHGDASSNRIIGIAKMLERLDYDVLVLGTNPELDITKLYKLSDVNIFYTTIATTSTFLNKISYFMGGLQFYEAIKKWKFESSDVIYVYGGYFFGNYYVYSKFKNKTKTIVDIVEWYSRTQKKSLGLIKYINNQIAIKWFYRKYKNKIVISEYLHKEFENSFILPPVVDTVIYPINKRIKGKIKIIYAGKSNGKDELVNFIHAYLMLEPSIQSKFEVIFYGVDESIIRRSLNGDTLIHKLEDQILFRKRVEHSEILEKISMADFTLLFRSNERYSQAGFPSKVPESLACGTPVFCNFSSDLEKYLENEVNSIISSTSSSEDIKIALQCISKLSRQEIQKMKINSRLTSERKLSIDSWQGNLRTFIETIE